MKPAGRRGFTLLEMVLVLSIASIGLTFALLSFMAISVIPAVRVTDQGVITL